MTRYRHRGKSFWPPRAAADGREEEATRGCGFTCDAKHGPFVCSRRKKHDGDHVAAREGGVIARWPQLIAKGQYRQVLGPDYCPECGTKLVWRALALVCPKGHGAFG